MNRSAALSRIHFSLFGSCPSAFVAFALLWDFLVSSSFPFVSVNAALSALVFWGFYLHRVSHHCGCIAQTSWQFFPFFIFIFPDLCFVNYFHGNISLNTSRNVGFTLHSDLLQVLLCIHKYAQHSWSGCISSNTCPRFTRQDQVEHSTHCSASWSLAWLLMWSDWLKRDISLFISMLRSKMNECR